MLFFLCEKTRGSALARREKPEDTTIVSWGQSIVLRPLLDAVYRLRRGKIHISKEKNVIYIYIYSLERMRKEHREYVQIINTKIICNLHNYIDNLPIDC